MKNPFEEIKKKIKINGTDSDINADDSNRFISFAKKIGNYFNTEPQREKVLRHEDFDVAGDVYFASVSAHYKVAQRILVLILVFFLLFSIVTNYKEITFDNFYYLVKDFTSASDAGQNSYETLSYESDSRQSFVLYRGGIATVSPSKISIFTATGRRTLNDTSQFSSPFAVSSDKYVLFYDTVGTKFSIYNSFARVYTEELENPVTAASLGNDGSFAVVTKSATGSWHVRLYNKSFNLKAVIPSDSYIFSISLNSDEQKLSVLSYERGNGTGRAVLTVYDISKISDEKGKIIAVEHETCFDGEFPIQCGYIKSGNLAVITDKSVRIFSNSYVEKNGEVDYSNGTLTGYSISPEGVAISTMRSANSYLLAYDENGNLLCDRSVSHNISDVCVYDSKIFLHIDQGIVRIDPSGWGSQLLTCGSGKMLVYNSETALLCGESKAEYLIFSK